MGALEMAAVGAADGSLTVARGRGWVAPPTGAGAAPPAAAGRARAGVAGRGGVAPRGMVLLPTGATGGAGRGGAPGAEGAVGAGGGPPTEGRGGGLRGTVGAGGLPNEGAAGAGRGARGTVAGGTSGPGALALKVIRTVSFLRGTAEVLVERPTEEVFLVGGGSSFSSWLMGKSRGGRGISSDQWQFRRGVSTIRGKRVQVSELKERNLRRMGDFIWRKEGRVVFQCPVRRVFTSSAMMCRASWTAMGLPEQLRRRHSVRCGQSSGRPKKKSSPGTTRTWRALRRW